MAAQGEGFKPNVNGVHRWAVGLVGGVVILSALVFVLRLLLGSVLTRLDPLMPNEEFDRLATQADRLMFTADIIDILGGVVFVAAVVTVLVWVHRAWRAIPPLGSGPMRWSPSWAVGAWFVPILNIWRPVQVIGDLNRSSRALSDGGRGNAWREDRFGATVWVWWLFSFFAGNLSHAAFRLEVRAEELEGVEWLDMMAAAVRTEAASDAFFAVGGLMLVRIISQVTGRIHALRVATDLNEADGPADSG